MEQAQPTKEHEWLARFAGEWSYQSECSMGPDQAPMKATGTESIRMMGDFWMVGESSGDFPGGGPMKSLMTLGYDPAKGKFVGTWTGSPMPTMFVYEGELEADGKTLPLNTVGPSMDDPTKTARYQDVVELVDDDTRVLRSRMLGDDGEWHPIMQARYTRVK